MMGNRFCVLALAAVAAATCFVPTADASRFDGNWTMTAVTTRGHCGVIPMGMSVKGGRIHSAGGMFAFYAIRLGGRVNASGHARIKAIAGPRVANGTGTFTRTSARGTWSGKGPSGLCSGYWRATRG